MVRYFSNSFSAWSIYPQATIPDLVLISFPSEKRQPSLLYKQSPKFYRARRTPAWNCLLRPWSGHDPDAAEFSGLCRVRQSFAKWQQILSGLRRETFPQSRMAGIDCGEDAQNEFGHATHPAI